MGQVGPQDIFLEILVLIFGFSIKKLYTLALYKNLFFLLLFFFETCYWYIGNMKNAHVFLIKNISKLNSQILKFPNSQMKI